MSHRDDAANGNRPEPARSVDRTDMH
jgi:hypothetical protein